MRQFIVFMSFLIMSMNGSAEQTQQVTLKTNLGEATDASKAIYLGNEAVLVEHKHRKILFDPFFHNGFNTYQLVPQAIRQSLFKGEPPYHNIDAVFISHAHGDHFAAIDLHKFLLAFPGTKVIGPTQAIEQIKALSISGEENTNLIAIDLAYQAPPISQSLPGITFDAVRIPHAGWPQRADVSNIVFRVILEDELSVIHMGDADTDDAHFKPLIEHWNSKAIGTAFPPYWFLTSRSGQLVLNTRIKAQQNIGVHVPIETPKDLIQSGAKYFSQPGEVLTLTPPNSK